MRDWAHSRRLGTPADEAGYVVLRQPPASKLANLFRIADDEHPRMMTAGSHDKVMQVGEVLSSLFVDLEGVRERPGG